MQELSPDPEYADDSDGALEAQIESRWNRLNHKVDFGDDAEELGIRRKLCREQRELIRRMKAALTEQNK